jgi:hypothetical protein
MQQLTISVPSNVGKTSNMAAFCSSLWKAYKPFTERVTKQGEQYLPAYRPTLPMFYRLKPVPALLR